MHWKRYINVKHQKKPIKHWMISLIHTEINIQRYEIDLRTEKACSAGFHFQKLSNAAFILRILLKDWTSNWNERSNKKNSFQTKNPWNVLYVPNLWNTINGFPIGYIEDSTKSKKNCWICLINVTNSKIHHSTWLAVYTKLFALGGADKFLDLACYFKLIPDFACTP